MYRVCDSCREKASEGGGECLRADAREDDGFLCHTATQQLNIQLPSGVPWSCLGLLIRQRDGGAYKHIHHAIFVRELLHPHLDLIMENATA